MAAASLRRNGAFGSVAAIAAIRYWLDARTIHAVAEGGALLPADWLDRSRHGRGGLQATAGAVYRRGVTAAGGPAVEFDGATSYCRSPSFALAQPIRVFVVARHVATFNGRMIDGNSVNQCVMNVSGRVSGYPGLGLYAGSSLAGGGERDATTRFTLYDATFDGAASALRVNDGLPTTGAGGSATYTAGVCVGAAGGLNAGFFYRGQIAEIIVCKSDELAPAEAGEIRAYLMAKHAIRSKRLLVCNGNSITRGYQTASDRGADYPAVVGSLLDPRDWLTVNTGSDGATTAQCATSMNGSGPIYTNFGYAQTLFVGWEGTNDIVVNNPGATAAYNALASYYSARKTTEGWGKVFAATIIDRSNFTTAMRADALSVNASLRANWPSFAHGLIDVEADSRFTIGSGASASTAIYADGVHPTDSGYAIVAREHVWPALRAVI